jgi:LmbE family N-acetylglucosaminyl deacetylase
VASSRRPRARWAAFLAALLAAGGAISVAELRSYFGDPSVPRTTQLVPPGAGKIVMAIFPHPDDEISCAGTLLLLHDEGVKTVLIDLTRGEAGPTGGLVSRADLGRARTEESHAAAADLHVDAIENLDFPDNGIMKAPPEKVKAAILSLIERYRPSVLITYDDKVGLYGHPDHRLSALYAREIFQSRSSDQNFPVKRLYQVTLSPAMIRTALRLSPPFRERYPREPGQGLPKADFAVDISAYGAQKKRAMLEHRTQRGLLNAMQPLIACVPGWLYFRVFASEYYANVTSR